MESEKQIEPAPVSRSSFPSANCREAARVGKTRQLRRGKYASRNDQIISSRSLQAQGVPDTATLLTSMSATARRPRVLGAGLRENMPAVLSDEEQLVDLGGFNTRRSNPRPGLQIGVGEASI